MWNLKTLKVQNMYNWKSIISNFQEYFTMYRWGIMYNDVLNKVVVYVTLHSAFKNENLKYDSSKESIHFYKFIFIKKWLLIFLNRLGKF
jgi:hypothetical protein